MRGSCWLLMIKMIYRLENSTLLILPILQLWVCNLRLGDGSVLTMNAGFLNLGARSTMLKLALYRALLALMLPCNET